VYKNTGSILGTIYKSSENANGGGVGPSSKDLGKKIQPLLIVNKLNNTNALGANYDIDDVSSVNN
jgi:hypothetical protein